MNRRILAALAVAALLLAACSSDDGAERVTPTTDGAQPHVLLLGDSNTDFAKVEIRAAMRDAGVAADLQGIPGFGLKENDIWLEALPRLLHDDPDAVLVALGANDAVFDSDATEFSGRLDRMMEALGDRPVVWFTHHEGRPEPAGSNARVVNAAIRAAPDRYDNLTVVDLAPDLAADPSLLDDDALHFSETGRPWFAKQLADAARAAVRGS